VTGRAGQVVGGSLVCCDGEVAGVVAEGVGEAGVEVEQTEVYVRRQAHGEVGDCCGGVVFRLRVCVCVFIRLLACVFFV
jgi:hypothetical protein